MTRLQPARLPQVREVLTEALQPRRLLLVQRGNGAVHLRVLSERFAGEDDPLRLVERILAERGLRLPDGVFTELRAPLELDPDEEAALFELPQLDTPTWPAALDMEFTGELLPDDRALGSAKVVAFWGIKGGVGRTTALSHVAAWLGQQKRVLAVDLDLDSPGLAAVLAEPWPEGAALEEPLRFDRLLIDAQRTGVGDAELSQRIERALRRARIPRVDVFGPLAADDEFVRSLLGPLNPDRLYVGARPGLRRVLRLAAAAARAEVILLDARSGYCQESAIAALDLADAVVMFASPTTGTYPSMAPALAALERRRQATGRPEGLHLVAGMLPANSTSREQILDALQQAYLEAREQVFAALDGRIQLLPADLSVVPIVYSEVVVENAGGLGLPTVSLGYRELAERIEVTLWPRTAPVTSSPPAEGQLQVILDEVQIPGASAEDQDDLPQMLGLFTRTPDTENLLRPSTALVLGPKGTGKTYLRRICLERPELLGADPKMRFVDVFSLRRGERGAFVEEDLRELDRLADGLNWRDIWSAIAAVQVGRARRDYRVMPRTPLIASAWEAALADASRPASEVLIPLARQPAALEHLWEDLSAEATLRGEVLVLLLDDLDVALGRSREDEPRRNSMLVGLLDRAMSSWLSRSGLSTKIFLRDDIYSSLHLQDRSKLERRALKLSWRAEDLWRMLVRAMAAGSSQYRARLEEARLVLSDLERLPLELLHPHLDYLWGRRMGSTEGATRTLSWLERRLKDGAGRLFPRAALWLLDLALHEQRRRGAPAEPPLLTAAALRDAMPEVANLRLGELENECTVAEWEQVLRLKGCDSFLRVSDLYEHLKRQGDGNPEQTLLRLVALGLVERAERRGEEFARIVDLYAFAPRLSIARLGRR